MARWSIAAIVFLSLAWGGLATPCQAQADQALFDLVVKSLRFVSEPPKGQTRIAIIYDPDSEQSIGEFDYLEEHLDRVETPGATLVPVRVRVDELEVLRDVRFAVFAGPLEDHLENIFAVTRAYGILSIAMRPACVEIGRCVMAVRTEPRNEVIVSRAASIASSVEFPTAFRMLIREL